MSGDFSYITENGVAKAYGVLSEKENVQLCRCQSTGPAHPKFLKTKKSLLLPAAI